MATEKTDPNFKDANYHQNAFIAISQAGQIRIGIFEHTIQHLIYNKLDFSHSNKRYNNANGGGCRPQSGDSLKDHPTRPLKRLHIESCHREL